MPKRKAKSNTTSTGHRTKRAKPLPAFGASITADDRTQRSNNPSSAALSTRNVKPSSPQSLASLCARTFAENFDLLSNEDNWEVTREWLKELPDIVIPKILAMLKMNHPKLLSHAVIVTYFLRGDSISLTGELGVTAETVTVMSRLMGERLHTLELSDFGKFSDATYTSLVSKLPALEVLVLRNCSKVGPKTAEAAGRSCPRLKTVNLNGTNVTPISLKPLITACPQLEVLKLASIQTFTDAAAAKLFASLFEGEGPAAIHLSNLRSLKLRDNSLSDTSISVFVSHCPALQRLDLSFTLGRHFPDVQTILPLEKLSLTSTYISSAELTEMVQHLPKLKILSIGALGVRPESSVQMSNSTAMTLNDDSLRRLTDALEGCHGIENINLVQNTKLGTTSKHDSALAYFVRRIGRKCKILNLSGIPSLRSSDLVGLLSEDNEPASPLHTLILNKTGINDDAAPWISSCSALEVLEVAETKFTEDGLFPIIDACPQLTKLNLTGCRGVNIVDRRRFFKVWEEREVDKE